MKKNIAIIILSLILIGGFVYFTQFSTKKYEEKILELEAKRVVLIQERDSLDAVADSLHGEYVRLRELDEKAEKEIQKKDRLIADLKSRSARSQQNLDQLKQGMRETQEKIESVKRNPANRTGEDLLESLKNKTQRK
jgi:peptidoglycan hydrolase CwlO-like protein